MPKNQNWYFNLKSGTETISNIQNLMFILSVLDWKHLFWANVVQNQNFQFKLKFVTYAEFSGDVYSFCTRLEIIFLGRFNPKTQNVIPRLLHGVIILNRSNNS